MGRNRRLMPGFAEDMTGDITPRRVSQRHSHFADKNMATH